ncbi:hypothetical protein AB7M74_011262 [Bradyrhizobium japonicum]
MSSPMKVSMPRFIVRFIKNVLGDNGQMDEICQTAIELDAPNGREAELQAKEDYDLERGFGSSDCL